MGLIVGLGGTTVGNLQFMCLLPWIASNFNPKMTGAFIGGNSFMSAVCVLLQIIQSPGDARRFSPTIYWTLLAIPTAIALPCALYIKSLVERRSKYADLEAGATGSYTKGPDEHDDVDSHDGEIRSAMEFLFPSFGRRVVGYTVLNVYMSAMTWWVLNTILPFASAATASDLGGVGEDVLMWASALSVLGLLLGTQLSSFVNEDMNFRLPHATALLTVMLVPVIMASCGYPQGRWKSRGAKIVIIAAVFIIRTSFGYMVPLIFRDINRKMPNISESAGQFCSFWTQAVSLLVLVGMFAVVKAGAFG